MVSWAGRRGNGRVGRLRPQASPDYRAVPQATGATSGAGGPRQKVGRASGAVARAPPIHNPRADSPVRPG